MSTHKHIDKICSVIIILSLLVTLLFMNGEKLGIVAAAKSMGYENRLFDSDKVHTIDIVMDNWDRFIETCENEEYAECNVVIDGEAYKSVGIRAKGNTSLSTVSQMDSERYSFKIEFDQYDSTKSYYGLDKLSLNNIIQDNSYMKDFLVYQLMEDFGVAAPLCSYVYITVNGEDWGLYLAVEGVEDGFLQRNYGSDYGELYKPDSLSFGGGRGNGKEFDMGEFNFEDFGKESFTERKTQVGGMSFGMGSSDVKLQYSDDNFDSYSNIFNNAKTDITDADKERLIESLKTLSSDNAPSVVNIDDVLRYFVVHNFVVNGDSYTGSMIHNYYLYEEDGILSMIPWDYNLAYGTFQGNNATDSVNDPIDSPVSGGSTDDRPMISWIFESEEYTELYHEYFAEFINKYFNSGYLEELINKTYELITPYVEKDPTKFCTYEEFETGVETIKQFCLLRAESISGQLDGTIPSTSEGQSADSSTLIDASSLSISDMGTMSNGMGGGGSRGEGFTMPEDSMGMQVPNMSQGEIPGMPNNSEENASTSDSFKPESGNNQQQRPSFGNMNGDFSFGDNMNMTENTKTDTNGYIMLGVSVVVLIMGLIVVFKFKR